MGKKSTKLPFTVEHTERNVLTVRIAGNAPDIDHWFLLSADSHWDNPKCRRDLKEADYREAVRRNAGIMEFGDFFCAMQGKYDKRSNKSSLRPEHQRGDYLDSLVDTAADWMKPYASNVLLISRGNHEQSIYNRHETDLIDRVCEKVRHTTGHRIQPGGYTGWVRFLITANTKRASVKLWYCHGWGGGGPVTVDTIQAANRMPMMVEGADVLVSGHVHESWVLEKPVTWLNEAGAVQTRTRHIVKCPTYKDEYEDGFGGWHVETGKPPKPLGAFWMRVQWSGSRPVLSFERTKTWAIDEALVENHPRRG